MSNSKVKTRIDSGPLPVLSPRANDNTGRFILWRTVPPQAGEAVRWSCVDGRWVSIGLGSGDDVGTAIVQSSSGQRRSVDSYEAALDLAKAWRTV